MLDSTRVASVEPLAALRALKLINVGFSAVRDDHLVAFLRARERDGLRVAPNKASLATLKDPSFRPRAAAWFDAVLAGRAGDVARLLAEEARRRRRRRALRF